MGVDGRERPSEKSVGGVWIVGFGVRHGNTGPFFVSFRQSARSSVSDIESFQTVSGKRVLGNWGSGVGHKQKLSTGPAAYPYRTEDPPITLR